jgi:hypothetical protein
MIIGKHRSLAISSIKSQKNVEGWMLFIHTSECRQRDKQTQLRKFAPCITGMNHEALLSQNLKELAGSLMTLSLPDHLTSNGNELVEPCHL